MQPTSKDYIVSFAEALPGGDNYGNVSYAVKFQDETDSALWKINPTKTKIEPGMTVYGHIEELTSKAGNPWRKFTRDQLPEGASQSVTSSPKTYSTGKPAYKKTDNSDGMRQGMCINNAANYVNAVFSASPLKPNSSEWAAQVHAHANALYRLGDLTMDDNLIEPIVEKESEMPKDFLKKEDVVHAVPDSGQIDMTKIDEMFLVKEKARAKDMPA